MLLIEYQVHKLKLSFQKTVVSQMAVTPLSFSAENGIQYLYYCRVMYWNQSLKNAFTPSLAIQIFLLHISSVSFPTDFFFLEFYLFECSNSDLVYCFLKELMDCSQKVYSLLIVNYLNFACICNCIIIAAFGVCYAYHRYFLFILFYLACNLR